MKVAATDLLYALPLCLEHCVKVAINKIYGREFQIWNLQGFTIWSVKFTHSSMGFGGMGTNGVTESHIIVVRHGNFFAVYVGGEFAYALDKPTLLFQTQFKEQKVPLLEDFRKDPELYCSGNFELGRWRGA